MALPPGNTTSGSGNMLPKKGSTLHKESQGGSRYAKAIAAALRKDLGNSHRAAKVVMGWTEASERTVKNWFSGKSGPSGEHLISLVHHSDRVLDAFLETAGRERSSIAVDLTDARRRVAEILDALDKLLAEQAREASQRK